MANNHMGDMDHAMHMIEEYSKILYCFKDTFDFAWKFQFRDLETFIHPDYKSNFLQYSLFTKVNIVKPVSLNLSIP